MRVSRCGAAGLECAPPEVEAALVPVRAVRCPERGGVGVKGCKGGGRSDDELGTWTQREKMESERAEAAA